MEHIYNFKDKVSYAVKGEMADAQFLTMLPPAGKNIVDIALIKGEVMAAMQWATVNHGATEVQEVSEVVVDDEADTEDSARSIMHTLDCAPDADTGKVILCIMELLIKGKLGVLDGENKLTRPIVDALSIQDTYGIAGHFIVNFILPSL